MSTEIKHCSPLLHLLYSLAAVTKLAFNASLRERNIAGVTLDKLDTLPSLPTDRASERYGISFRKLVRDHENVAYLVVSSRNSFETQTSALCGGRRLQWLVEILEKYNDIYEGRIYGASLLEDYSVIDGIPVEDDRLIQGLLSVVTKHDSTPLNQQQEICPAAIEFERKTRPHTQSRDQIPQPRLEDSGYEGLNIRGRFPDFRVG